MSTKLRFEDNFTLGKKEYKYYSIEKAAQQYGSELLRLPCTLKILLENALRNSTDNVRNSAITAMLSWIKDHGKSEKEIAYKPGRVLMQDFTGVPAIIDLASMRDAMEVLEGDPRKINPQIPVDLVIDHSVQVNHYGTKTAFKQNVAIEFSHNHERYEFLKWGQESFKNFRVIPPGTGICHQVNLEYLAQVVLCTKEKDGKFLAFPDTVIGTDSHTTMVNGLGVLGWGVGGIEAEASMLGEQISMVIPEVVGFKITGKLREGVTATDLVLSITNILRKEVVVGKFVEFYGDGLDYLSLPDRATIANMSPEYGATCAFFPVDNETLRYLEATGRKKDNVVLVETYAKKQGLWHNDCTESIFTHKIGLDASKIEPCIAGPKRPQDIIPLSKAQKSFREFLASIDQSSDVLRDKNKQELYHGDVVIAAITSCTNTSNPDVMMAAGLVAKKAVEIGMSVPSWVKTSLAPGSQIVSEYLNKSGLQYYLDQLGFNLVGYGCTTCIGNSGPLKSEVSGEIKKRNLAVASVLSGNRNFEGRIHPLVSANYLASPPLVVIYALAGSMNLDVVKDPIGKDKNGGDVFLKDLWPSNKEIHQYVGKFLSRKMFVEKYKEVFFGDDEWRRIKIVKTSTYKWHKSSTYIQHPPYFSGMSQVPGKIEDVIRARILCMFGDSITTDHISPAGDIDSRSPAGQYLAAHNISDVNFNSYGARRGNHEVMMRGTFANIRIRNEVVPNKVGAVTIFHPTGKEMSIYDAAMSYQKSATPLVVIAGKEYGSGSSRDWAAKGPKLLGVRAVIAESFERIHRSNLIGMGIMPLSFIGNANRKTLDLTGNETIDIVGFDSFSLGKNLLCRISYSKEKDFEIELKPLIYTQAELEYIKNNGVLNYVLRWML